MPNRYDDRDERRDYDDRDFADRDFGGRGRDDFSRGGFGGYYARDTHRGGYGDDYARDGGWSGGGGRDDYAREPRWGGTGAPGDWGAGGMRGRGTAAVGYGPGQTRSTYGDNNLGGSAAAYGGNGSMPSFRGRGPKNWRRSDERIREVVNELLTEHDGIDATEVDVNVQEGEVTLSGTVGSRWEKRLAEDIAHSCTGVRDVHNRLTIADREAQVGKASE